MQNSLLKILKAQIEDEMSGLDELHVALNRRVTWLVEGKVADPYLVEDIFAALAMNIHAFYTGCERILLRLINNIDGGISRSAEWHQELLRQATLNIPGVRGPIIARQDIYEFLSELRGLRHIIRNVYTHQLKRDNLLSLAKLAMNFHPRFKQEIIRFMNSLEIDT